MCKSLIAVNMSLPSPRSNNVLTACQIRNWFWNCFNEAVNKFAGAWPSERPPRHQPRSPAVALLTVPKWGWGTQRLTVWLLRICKLWAGISGPVPISEVPCTLDLFWSVCVWVSAFPFQLCSPPSPHPPPPQKIPATVEPHWEYCASQFGDLSWQSRRTVERWRPGCGLNLFNLHHCPQWRSWPTIALPPKFLHPPFVSPERWEKLVRFCQLAKARPPSCSQLPVSWHGGGRCRNGQVWFAITLEEQLLPGISTPPDRYGEKSKATFQIRPNLKRRVA